MLENIPKTTTKNDNFDLMNHIGENILKAIWGLEPIKVLGADGFSISFSKNYWSLIKTNLKRILQYVKNNGKVGGNTNSSFPSLIPKEANPSSFSML